MPNATGAIAKVASAPGLEAKIRKIAESFESQSLHGRVRDLVEKIGDLAQEESWKNIADVVMSAMWLELYAPSKSDALVRVATLTIEELDATIDQLVVAVGMRADELLACIAATGSSLNPAKQVAHVKSTRAQLDALTHLLVEVCERLDGDGVPKEWEGTTTGKGMAHDTRLARDLVPAFRGHFTEYGTTFEQDNLLRRVGFLLPLLGGPEKSLPDVTIDSCTNGGSYGDRMAIPCRVVEAGEVGAYLCAHSHLPEDLCTCAQEWASNHPDNFVGPQAREWTHAWTSPGGDSKVRLSR